ncbi:hypothetical protein KL86PLE_90658 [uncultured Pleomorphomonas sp.]|uniref:Uncharacterized protein n=1 Tax=uncultured Pleomorphomonas sp. TaxID=442121 RepID=A0A212LQG6_9HYPH|nr:hypothetical protein [uncultured Pleomorphomonas sp.]SCM79824.1 hypothetical protein KL86PLE_90658 [uncultured Pleomorphomonas sp.]
MADRAYLERLTKDLVDQGKLVEAGWNGLRLAAIPLNTPAAQLEEMRAAFFAGAHHLFASLMCVFDEDEEPTDADLRKLDLIERELAGFIRDYEMKHVKTEGSA